jgi:hypothetical protein
MEEELNRTPENAPQAEAQAQPSAEEPEADGSETVIFERSLALSVSASRDAQIESSLALAMVAGNHLAANDSLGGVYVSGGDLQIQQGGGGLMVVGGQANLDRSFIGLLLPGGEVNLGENSKILLTTRQALAIGAGLGVVFALLNAFLRRLRK